jgi:hypothetical protein
VEVFNELRKEIFSDAIKSLINKDFVSYIQIGQVRCRLYVFSSPLAYYAYKHYVLHDDDRIKVFHDGSVQAMFSIVALNLALTNAAQIVQTWIPAEEICNYQLKQENYTDYRCFTENIFNICSL